MRQSSNCTAAFSSTLTTAPMQFSKALIHSNITPRLFLKQWDYELTLWYEACTCSHQILIGNCHLLLWINSSKGDLEVKPSLGTHINSHWRQQNFFQCNSALFFENIQVGLLLFAESKGLSKKALSPLVSERTLGF